MLKKLFLLILLSLLSLNVFAHGNEWIGSANTGTYESEILLNRDISTIMEIGRAHV